MSSLFSWEHHAVRASSARKSALLEGSVPTGPFVTLMHSNIFSMSASTIRLLQKTKAAVPLKNCCFLHRDGRKLLFHHVLRNHFLVPLRAELRCPLLGFEIHVMNPKPLAVPIRPLEVVH